MKEYENTLNRMKELLKTLESTENTLMKAKAKRLLYNNKHYVEMLYNSKRLDYSTEEKALFQKHVNALESIGKDYMKYGLDNEWYNVLHRLDNLNEYNNFDRLDYESLDEDKKQTLECLLDRLNYLFNRIGFEEEEKALTTLYRKAFNLIEQLEEEYSYWCYCAYGLEITIC